jgi:hypothetical protein
MSELNEPAPAARRNPLMWVTLVVIGLILFVFLGGDREDALPRVQVDAVEPGVEEYVAEELAAGTIERSLLIPPGMRARETIQQLRSAGKPYPLSQVFDRAQKYQHEGSLADAHLLYFFAARESHLPSVMMMAEMSDPLLFRAENSLLDQADAIQAFKWYRMATELGQPGVADRLEALRGWANDAAATGDSQAEQLLLSIQ